MVDATKVGERERRRQRRWQVGGALAALVVMVGGVATIAGIDRHEKRRASAATAEVVLPKVAQATPSESPPTVGEQVATNESIARTPTPTPTTAAAPLDSTSTKPVVFAPVDDEALALVPNDPAPVDHLAKSDALLKSGDKKNALVEARLALFAKPDDPAILGRIAKLDDGDLGDRALEKIVRVSKTDTDAPRELAKRRLDAKDVKGALPMAIEACRRAPKSWAAWEVEGRAYLADGRLGPAVEAFKKATAQDGAPSYPFNNLGLALMLSGRYDDALTALNTAVERGPVEAYMMNNLGLAYEKVGRLDESEVAFLGALELRSDYVKAQVNLERVGNEKDALAKKEADDKAAEAKKETPTDAALQGDETTAQSSGAPAPTTPLHGG